MLDFRVQLDLQPFEFEVRKKIKLGLKNYVISELTKIFNIPTDFGNFIDLVKRIDQNFYKYKGMHQQQANQYNYIIVITWGQYTLPWIEILKSSSITFLTCSFSHFKPTKSTSE